MTRADPDGSRLPLSALLSQALVAFTIEFDNESERQIQHLTTRHGAQPGGVWLVSMVMWLNCMRYLSAEPMAVEDIAGLARSGTNLAGLQRWGYLTAESAAGCRPVKARDKGVLVRATVKGQRAQGVWRPLTDPIEQRWNARFGGAEIAELRESLAAIAGELPGGRDGGLPDCLPILGYGLYTLGKGPGADRFAAVLRPAREVEVGPATETAAEHRADADDLALPWLLARVLLAYAIEFERESTVSLAITANLLRVLTEDGVRVRDLPLLTGVSKESITMATGFTASRGLTEIEPDRAGGRWKLIRLTPKGARFREKNMRLINSIEDRWVRRYGASPVARLRLTHERLARPAERGATGEQSRPAGIADPAGTAQPGSLLFAGLEPHPDGWRASVRKPVTLPQYPMVLHRGGYPDGS